MHVIGTPHDRVTHTLCTEECHSSETAGMTAGENVVGYFGEGLKI